MGRKAKVSYEDKIKACEEYINGISSAKQLADRLGISGVKHILVWARRYQEKGPESLRPKQKNSSYTKEFKKMVVEEYLNGEGSIPNLSIKHNIPGIDTLRQWIIKYNNLNELKDYKPKPEVYKKMAYRKKTTMEERTEIVKYCIDHGKDYKNTASLYDVSYSQVYDWVKKYLEKGEDGLSDKRGKHKEESELSEMEKLQRQNKFLEAKIKELEMESVLLKKVQEIERRRYSPKRKTK